MSERSKYTRRRRGGRASEAPKAPDIEDVPPPTPVEPVAVEKTPDVPPAAPVVKTRRPSFDPNAQTAEDTSQRPKRPRRVVVKATQTQPAPVVLPASARAKPEPLVLEVPQPAPPTPAPAPAPVQQPPEPVAAPAPAPKPGRAVWDNLGPLALDGGFLERNRIISATRRDPSHTAFDVLRTRLLHALSERGWNRVAVTSPTKDCGKTFVSANLAISMSRQETCRTVLMDMDLRRPSLANVLGAPNPGAMGDFLRGQVSVEDHFVRPADNGLSIGHNIALGLNSKAEGYASELLQLPETSNVLHEMHEDLQPDVVLYDMPPALYFDDVMAFRPHIDGVLLVVGGGITKASEIRNVERRLGDTLPLLGVIMNKAEGIDVSNYTY